MKLVYKWMKTADVFLHLLTRERQVPPVVANEDGLGLSETIDLYPREILPYKAEKGHAQKLARVPRCYY
jgi:hypothetical protein